MRDQSFVHVIEVEIKGFEHLLYQAICLADNKGLPYQNGVVQHDFTSWNFRGYRPYIIW